MRKYFSIAAIAAFILILFTSCSADMIFVDNNMVSNNQTNSINSSYELALITDAGETYDIENDEYIFNAWLGLKNYAEEIEEDGIYYLHF